MNLREEIRKSIEPNAKSFYDEKIIVDKVLQLFEKRIDEKFEDDKQTINNLILDGYEKNKVRIEQLSTRMNGYLGIMEMLK